MGAITFPNLGIELNPDRVAFTLFGKGIYWYGIIIAFGFVLAVLYGMKRAKTVGLIDDNILDMLFAAVPAAIVCARLYYCIFNWELYANEPISILYIWEGGLAIYGGIIGALVAVAICCKHYHLQMASAFDIAAMGLPIGQSIGRWGNFINGEAHGTVTDSLFGMTINGEGPFHPTFLYESIWNLIGFVILDQISRRCYRFRGQLFLFYLMWYGLGRAVIEGLRTDSLYLGNTTIRVSQLLALITLVIALFLTIACLRKKVKTIVR